MRNRRFFFAMLLCFPLLLGFISHPFFVGVTQIFIQTSTAVDNNCIVEVKLFTDDLQRALKEENGVQFSPEKPSTQEIQTHLSRYFNAHVKLSLLFQKKAKGKITTLNVPLHVKGWSVEEEATWVYLLPSKTIQYQSIKQLKQVHLENNALIKQLPSQTHIVHCFVNGNRKTEQLTGERTKVDFYIK